MRLLGPPVRRTDAKENTKEKRSSDEAASTGLAVQEDKATGDRHIAYTTRVNVIENGAPTLLYFASY